jgi:hypothetical protein
MAGGLKMQDRLGVLTTVVLAALGWLLTHYVDRLTASPTLEYSIASHEEGPRHRHLFRLRNVNRLTSYGPLKLTFQAPTGGIVAYSLTPIEPTSEGDEFPRVSRDSAEFTIPKLMPNGAIKVALVTRDGVRPVLSVESATDIRLTRSGFETWLVRHELTVMGALIAIWLVALGFILIVKKPGKSEALA